jgi:FkbM family methyltransferase
VILDWDKRSPLPDGRCIHNPHVDVELWDRTGTGDAAVLAALTELSSLLVGVDSGPLHVAGATTTPTIAVWTRHHPLHYFALADHVTHLVPEKHRELLRGDRDVGEAYFREHYRSSTYAHLAEDLVARVQNALKDPSGELIYARNFWIRSNNAEQDLVVVKDIAEDDSYRVGEFPVEGPVVVDVGAHIGCFCHQLHQRHPGARILAVECCPENIPALTKNVGGFATVVQAAVTYERDVALLNAVYPNCVTTGGSTVIARAALERQLGEGLVGQQPDGTSGNQYWADFRSMTTLTLEDIVSRYGLQRIDILKLDCEGSEFSILQNTTSLDRIGLIVGEYHGRERFLKLVANRFAGWELRILKDGELGTFWLSGGQRP